MLLGPLIKRLLPCFVLLATISCHAEAVHASGETLDAEHQRGVDLAREGHYDEGLAVLTALLSKYPDNYPIQRDIVVITAWKGDCRTAVRRYEPIREHPDLEPYLVLPVSECLINLGRINEATALLEQGQKNYPDDPDLPAAYASALAKRSAQLLNEVRVEVSTDTSDQGKREWLIGSTLSRKLEDRTSVYVRYANTHSSYAQYQSGMLNRIGVGIQHEFLSNIIATQEVSEDVHRSGQAGSYTSVGYLPSDLWRVEASYTSFAEDLPLRAQAELITAKRSIVSTGYHSADYRWSWDASGSHYDFSDTNGRTALFTSVGYAYELQPHREQRVFLEYYQSSNTLANAIYYNPAHDSSVSVVNQTNFVFDSRFRRHVDHLYLTIGSYDEEGYSQHETWDVRYVQDYDFTDRLALSAGVGYGRHVYDGASEYESSLDATFRWLF
ncbi:MAG: PgaA family protein [Sulfuricaulis sp.]